ncbi:MAG: hypothetical protein ABJB97_11675 [Acidobacteriota bacterium]
MIAVQIVTCDGINKAGLRLHPVAVVETPCLFDPALTVINVKDDANDGGLAWGDSGYSPRYDKGFGFRVIVLVAASLDERNGANNKRGDCNEFGG